MSPINAMERSYTTLKQMLREGAFPPGARLEANKLAYELGVSMTPIRDALHCLTGENLVEAAIGEGFRAPRFSGPELRDLYEWNAALMSMASRTTDMRFVLDPVERLGSPADQFAGIIGRIAEGVPNREVSAALINANERLHPFRIRESELFDDLQDELNELVSAISSFATQVKRYHLRRMRVISQILRLRGQS